MHRQKIAGRRSEVAGETRYFTSMPIATINPASGETLKTFEPLTATELEARLQCAAEAYQRHRRTTFAERARMMLRAAEILESEKDRFGRLMVTEMGKPLQAARDEAAKSAFGCRYYAENAERFMADEVVETPARLSLVRYQPIGPVLAVMPWNFPFWQVFRFAAPALMAGNVGLLKHASNVPQCALAIEEIFRRAGFAEGVFQTLLLENERVRAVIEDPRIAAVTLTGSTGAGASVARLGGQGHQEKRARAGRQRSVHRDAERRFRYGGAYRGEGARHQQWTVVHRREAVHRA